MTLERPLTLLCLASYPAAGPRFLRACKRAGCTVILLTTGALLTADWPRDAIDELYTLPGTLLAESPSQVLAAVGRIGRRHRIDLVIPLDEFDLEPAALVRGHLRLPGLSESATRLFRDKLAMRLHGQAYGLRAPPFVHALHHDSIRQFLQDVPGPWLLKPRGMAGGRGIKRIDQPDDVWPLLEELGEQASNYLIEKTIPGEGYHVDAIHADGRMVFVEGHRVRRPLLKLTEHGGVFGTRTVRRGSDEERELLAAHESVVAAFGHDRCISHTEFLRSEIDGKFYFLETAARPGGAYITDLVEESTGINLWEEWARLELGQGKVRYELPSRRFEHGGNIISRARDFDSDLSSYDAPEVSVKLRPEHGKKPWVVLVMHAPSYDRIEELLDLYEPRVWHDFWPESEKGVAPSVHAEIGTFRSSE